MEHGEVDGVTKSTATVTYTADDGDVETALLLKKHHIKIIELPLKWKHKDGSKVNLIKDSIKIFFDLIILKVR